MTNNQWGSCFYSNQHEMLDAIAYDWLSDGGVFGDFERDVLEQITDDELAAECVKGWQLNEALPAWPNEEPEPSHMEGEGYDTDDLVKAFSRLRERAASLPNGEV